MSKDKLNRVPTDNFDDLFWAFNSLVQISYNEENDTYNYVGYMPRKESCYSDTIHMTQEELEIVCNNTAITLRNLADLFEDFPKSKRMVYYPDRLVVVE